MNPNLQGSLFSRSTLIPTILTNKAPVASPVNHKSSTSIPNTGAKHFSAGFRAMFPRAVCEMARGCWFGVVIEQ